MSRVRVCNRCSKVIGTDDAYYSITKAVRGSEPVFFHADETACDTYTQPASTQATDDNPGLFYTSTVTPNDMPAERMKPDVVQCSCSENNGTGWMDCRVHPQQCRYASVTTPKGVVPVDFRNRGG